MFTETRRQLLEYYHSDKVDGVLFVNADKDTVQEVQFLSKNTHCPSLWWRYLLAITIGTLIGYALALLAM